MKKIPILLAFLLLFSSVSTVTYAKEDSLTALKAQITSLQKQVKELTTKVKSYSSDNSKLKNDLKNTKKDNAKLTDQLKKAKKDNARLTDQLKDVTSQLDKETKSNITAENVYKKMIALKEQYPEGMRWTNDNYYEWKGGIYSVGYGCAGFAFILSDKAFGSLPARKHKNFDNIQVGDIIRINNNTHSVVILSIDETTVTLAEGNYNSSIHWGRVLTLKQLKDAGDYIMTRYPK